jgi:threonine/homoserine/homoserine lactone efflux protein
MELLSLFITSFIVGFSGAIMPGPLLAVDIAETPSKGLRTGPILTFGHGLAEIVVVILLSIGLATIVSENKTIEQAIGVIGGGMLIFMGIGMIIELRKQTKANLGQANTKAKSGGRLIFSGIVTSLSNPYWFVWWATTGSAFLIKSLKYGIAGPAVFYFGHILSDLVWYSLISFLIWKGRKIISGTGYRILIVVCALFLLYLGGRFIYDGIIGAI